MAPLLTVETRAGQAIEYDNNTLVPFSQVWHFRLPWAKGGLIWNRPVSVVLRHMGNQETVIPVQDITRQALWLLFGLSFTSVVLAFLSNQKNGPTD